MRRDGRLPPGWSMGSLDSRRGWADLPGGFPGVFSEDATTYYGDEMINARQKALAECRAMAKKLGPLSDEQVGYLMKRIDHWATVVRTINRLKVQVGVDPTPKQ